MAETLKMKGIMRAHTDMVTSIDILNADIIVSASRDKSIILWELTKGDEAYGVINKRFSAFPSGVKDVVVSSDGQYALSGGWNKEFGLLDLATGRSIRQFVGHTEEVLSVAFSLDNRQIVSSSYDGTIKLWNTRVGNHTISKGGGKGGEGHKDWVSCVRFSSNTVVSASWDSTVKVWSLPELELMSTIDGHTGPVCALALSPDHLLCASGCKHGIILLRELLADGDELLSLQTRSVIHHLCFKPPTSNSELLLCAATENGIQIWDLAKNELVETLYLDVDLDVEAQKSGATLTGTMVYCTSLKWSSDGSTLFSGYTDGVIRVWSY